MKCEDESDCNAKAIFLDGSAKVCEDHTMSDTPQPLEMSIDEAFEELDKALAGVNVTLHGKPLVPRCWFMTYTALSKYGESISGIVIENRHPFEQLKVLQDRNAKRKDEEHHVPVNYTLLSFQPISRAEYDLAVRLEIGIH